MYRRGKWTAGIAALVISLSAFSACGSDEPDKSSTSGTKDASVIEVTFTGDEVEPNGKRVEVQLNQPVKFEIEADKPGELHIHSKPEQEIAYAEGTSTHEVSFDKTGVFAVESHDLEKAVVELEVR